MNSVQMVEAFLRAQNLEQIGRNDEAVALYEEIVSHGFDASGPYDRLISVYSHQARHSDVVRIADAALVQVQTHDAKKSWYRDMRAAAASADRATPEAAPKRSRK